MRIFLDENDLPEYVSMVADSEIGKAMNLAAEYGCKLSSNLIKENYDYIREVTQQCRTVERNPHVHILFRLIPTEPLQLKLKL